MARRLGVADPSHLLGRVLDDTLSAPFGDPSYAGNALLPGATPVEVSFSEAMPAALRFDFEAVPRGGRRDRTTAALTRCVRARFGAAAATQFEARTATLVEQAPDDGFGLFAGAVCDAAGLCELKAYVPAARSSNALANAAKSELPALDELMHAVSARRGGVAERVYLVCTTELELISLQPVLARFGLAHRLPELVVTLLRLTGGAFVLPASSCVLGLRPLGRAEVEVKVEVFAAGALAARDVAALFAERPSSRLAFDRWLDAISSRGADVTTSVVSARVTRDAPVGLGVYAYPVVEPRRARPVGVRELAGLLG